MSAEMYKLARPKLTGVPCQILNGVPQGVVNKMVLDILGGLPQFKGEIVVGVPQDEKCHDRTVHWLEQETAMFLFVFWVYDLRTTGPYALRDRLQMADQMIYACGPHVQFVDHTLIQKPEELEEYQQFIAERGFKNGVVLREPFGTYGTEDEEIA